MNFCKGCNASCCRDYTITITSFDILRIMANTGRAPDSFAQIIPARLLNQDEEAVLECYREGERYDYILALKSHPCIFLAENGSCSIHAFSPLVCGMYPLNSAGKMHKSPRCPPLNGFAYFICGAGAKKEEYRRQISEYKKLVSRWNSKRGKLEDCMEFLLKESGKEKK